MGEIHRSADGRFVINGNGDEIDGVIANRISIANSLDSSSDDGGFLPKKNYTNNRFALWRRPLLASPSQLSFKSNLSLQNGLLGGLQRTPANHLQKRPVTQNLHINTISANVPDTVVMTPYTPGSRISRFHASSPASSLANTGVIMVPWSPMYFSDLSSVQQPSSAERSFPTPPSNHGFHRSYYGQYGQELPTLQAIHEEARRTNGFVPVHVPMQESPSMRYFGTLNHRPRFRYIPRMERRIFRSNSEFGSPSIQMERSPESRSSSSGFGSKNTSSQHNHSSRSGSSAPIYQNEIRQLPPYRPPPPPSSSTSLLATVKPTTHHNYHHHHHIHHHPTSLAEIPPVGYKSPIPSSNNMNHWLDLITRLNAESEKVNLNKSVDVGSVDGHYEFDPSTPTPTASTPTGGPRDDQILDHLTRKRQSRYENIDARVQSMKEEFYEYRKRQASRHTEGTEIGSTC